MKFIINFKLPIILFTSFLIRLITLFYFRDVEVDNEWGILLENLEMNNILSVHSVQEFQFLIFLCLLSIHISYIVSNYFYRLSYILWTIQFIQISLAVITVYFTFKILREFFSENISCVGTLIFAVFPLNVYASSQISSITLQVFYLIYFYFLTYNYLKVF